MPSKSNISAEVFIKLWDRLLVDFWRSDTSLSEDIGVRHTTIAHYRKGRSKTVTPDTLGSLENALGIKIYFTKTGELEYRREETEFKNNKRRRGQSIENDDLGELISMLRGEGIDDSEKLRRLLRRLQKIQADNARRINSNKNNDSDSSDRKLNN